MNYILSTPHNTAALRNGEKTAALENGVKGVIYILKKNIFGT